MSTSLSDSRDMGSRRSGYLAQLWAKREFTWALATGNIRAQHSQTTLGVVWWVLSPLFLGAVYLLVFGIILDRRRGDPNYIGFLLSGLFPFYFTRAAMASGAKSILSNARLITTRLFPRLVLPISAILEGAIGFLASLVPFFVIAGVANGDWPGTHTLWLVPAFMILVIFNFGLTVVIAQLLIPFRDIQSVLPYLTRVWLYLSPVIFPLDQRLKNLSEQLFTILQFNPMASILGLFRVALLDRPVESWMIWGSIAWAFGLTILGTYTFMRNEWKFVKYL